MKSPSYNPRIQTLVKTRTNFMLLCFILIFFKSVSIIDKVFDYEFFLFIDFHIFISFQVRISIVKRDRS